MVLSMASLMECLPVSSLNLSDLGDIITNLVVKTSGGTAGFFFFCLSLVCLSWNLTRSVKGPVVDGLYPLSASLFVNCLIIVL